MVERTIQPIRIEMKAFMMTTFDLLKVNANCTIKRLAFC
jgi:hypothetical protein